MPRFLFATPPIDATERDRAIALAAQRFPEVAIELKSRARDGQDIWLCDAPHHIHVRRWAAAAGIELSSIAGSELLSDPSPLGVANNTQTREEVSP